MTRNLLTAEQVARRLGVRLETVYAYVSRGVLRRTLAEDGRSSRFETKQVEELAQRGRPRKGATRAGSVEVSLVTAITGIVDDRLLFRGYDATELATESTFEAVAELLWSGVLPERLPAWKAPSREVSKSLRLPARTASPLERLCMATAALAAAYPLRVDLRAAPVSEHARLLLAAFSQILPAIRAEAPRVAREPRLARRLLPRLSPLAPTPKRVGLIDAALVLLADHELATSTLAARIAASTRADPFGVVLAGLGAVSGPLHGRAAGSVQSMIVEAFEASPEVAIARFVSRAERIPGFGHPVYRGIDPRCACLLKELEPTLKSRERSVIDRLVEIGAHTSSKQPNVDFALGALAFALEMPLGSSEALFAIARSAGWIAHALEEYAETPLRFRARSIYIGPNRPD